MIGISFLIVLCWAGHLCDQFSILCEQHTSPSYYYLKVKIGTQHCHAYLNFPEGTEDSIVKSLNEFPTLYQSHLQLIADCPKTVVGPKVILWASSIIQLNDLIYLKISPGFYFARPCESGEIQIKGLQLSRVHPKIIQRLFRKK